LARGRSHVAAVVGVVAVVAVVSVVAMVSVVAVVSVEEVSIAVSVEAEDVLSCRIRGKWKSFQ
jgi:hypothetical protein